MSKRSKIKALFSVLMVLTVALTAITLPGCQKKGKIKIGAILPLTEDGAVYGDPLKKGMDLAVEELNAHGGINGKKLVIVYEDGIADPKTSVAAFQKLTSTLNCPIVIGPMFSAPTLAVVPIAQSQKVVLLSPTASAVELTDAGEYFYRIYPSDVYDGEYLARFCFNELKARKVGIIYLQVSSTVAISEVFTDVFTELGGDVVSSQAYQEGDIDFKTQLKKVSVQNPDVIFIPGYLQEMALLLRQAKELGIEAQFVSISTFYDPEILTLAGDAAEGVYFSAPAYDPESEESIVKEFVSAYQDKYGSEPNIWAGYGYDVVRVAAQGLEAGPNSNKIREAFNKLDNFPGVTGNVTFDENGDVKKDLRILVVRGGQFESFEEAQ